MVGIEKSQYIYSHLETLPAILFCSYTYPLNPAILFTWQVS